MEASFSSLPLGWERTTVRDVVLPFKSIDPSRMPDFEFQYVDIGSIDNKLQEISCPKAMTGKDAPSRARRIIKTNDTLFSTVRTYLKNIALVPSVLDGAVTSTGISVLRPGPAIEPKFLFNLTRSSEFLARIGVAMDGTMYPAVTDNDVLDQVISLPPLNEQRRIVAKLDSLLARSRRAREELARVPQLVERYKQAVLAAAFRGELTVAWRKSNACHVVSHTLETVRHERNKSVLPQRRLKALADLPQVPSSLPCIPSTWAWICIEELASDENRSIQSGPFGSNLRHSEFQEKGNLVIGIDNVQDVDWPRVFLDTNLAV